MLVHMPAEVHGRIGAGLRALYADLLAEPVPERFVSLVDQLGVPAKIPIS
jgi:hypothetical protein